jgi:hypothetical protein
MQTLTFECPGCGLYVQVPQSEVRCGHFIHAAYKKTGQVLNPHVTDAELLRRRQKIFGCGTRLLLTQTNDIVSVVIKH